DRYAFGPLLERVERCNSDICEVAESHGPITRGVVPRRPHQAQRGFTLQGTPRGGDSGAGRADGMLVNVGISRGIGIEFMALLLDPLNVFGGMGAQQSLPGSSDWKMPMPVRMPFAQKRSGGKNPLRALRMA